MPEYFLSSPRNDGFRMPGEFESHAGCWMLWPERPDTWRLSAVPAQNAFAQVSNAIAEFEPVYLGASPGQILEARKKLNPNVKVVEIRSNDAWMRDVGPTFVVNDLGDVRGVHWDFNGWGGGIYETWEMDKLVAGKVMDYAGISGYKTPDFVLEGGSITVDGQGTLITTEECLLNTNRNPHLRKSDIERKLIDHTNIRKIIWLRRGLDNDETSGHVDNLCCFIRPGVVALAWCNDPADPQFERTHEAYDTLADATDAGGRKFTIHRIQLPDTQRMEQFESDEVLSSPGVKSRRPGDYLAASYINFYVANGGVIVPTFGDRNDQPALQTIHELFKGRLTRGIYSREILLGGGNIHCITQPQPAGKNY